MCRIVEELNEKAAAYAAERAAEATKTEVSSDIARKLFDKGMDVSEISEVTSLTVEQVREAIGIMSA